ncbi:hypothetical protein RJT34_30648 [Clitoria ternatea]|uniref:Uncharacterized protein n=1 Tax=Clitoria ternatea TaxID=43366 RepID=A0AAN9I2U5_CLITE
MTLAGGSYQCSFSLDTNQRVAYVELKINRTGVTLLTEIPFLFGFQIKKRMYSGEIIHTYIPVCFGFASLLVKEREFGVGRFALIMYAAAVK